MSRAVRPEARDSFAGAAEVSGACWTMVVVLPSPTAPVSSRIPAVTPPPRTAATSGIANARAVMTPRSVVDPAECGLNQPASSVGELTLELAHDVVGPGRLADPAELLHELG